MKIMIQHEDHRPVFEGALQKAGLSEVCAVSCMDDGSVDLSRDDTLWVVDAAADDVHGPHDARDVFTRPVRMGDILDRIQRKIGQKTGRNEENTAIFSSFTLDLEKNTLYFKKNGKKTRVTDLERDILMYLHQNKDNIVTKRQILDEVWGYAYNVETHTLETHIYRLRQKIEENPSNPQVLITDGDGYRLV